MAINYERVMWDTTKYVNPSNMNQMDEGIKDACDGVDRLDGDMTQAQADITQAKANITENAEEISAINTKIKYIDTTVSALTLNAHASDYRTVDYSEIGTDYADYKVSGATVIGGTSGKFNWFSVKANQYSSNTVFLLLTNEFSGSLTSDLVVRTYLMRE